MKRWSTVLSSSSSATRELVRALAPKIREQCGNCRTQRRSTAGEAPRPSVPGRISTPPSVAGGIPEVGAQDLGQPLRKEYFSIQYSTSPRAKRDLLTLFVITVPRFVPSSPPRNCHGMRRSTDDTPRRPDREILFDGVPLRGRKCSRNLSASLWKVANFASARRGGGVRRRP